MNISNVSDIEYTVLMEMLHDTYCKELPTVDITTPINNDELEKLMIFFANQYAYITELWARMSHEVRSLKRMDVKNKDSIDMAMDKRDYLEKVMSACKIKYYGARILFRYHKEEMG